MDLGKVGHQLLLHNSEDQTSQHRAPDCPDPANYRHQQDVNAGLEGEYPGRIDKGGITRKYATGNSRQAGCDGVDGQLVSERIHAQVGRRIFILLDRAQSHPELAVYNQKRNRYGDRGNPQGGIVMINLTERAFLHDAKAAGPSGDAQVVHDDAGCFAHADGGDGEVRPAQAEGRQSDEDGSYRRNDARRNK